MKTSLRTFVGNYLWPPQPDRLKAVTASKEAIGVGDGGSLAEVFTVDGVDHGTAHVRVYHFDLENRRFLIIK